MLRRRAKQIILAAFVLSRLIIIARIQAEPYLISTLAHYAKRSLPPLVCPSDMDYMNEGGYYAVLYAVIPSILVGPGVPCETHHLP